MWTFLAEHFSAVLAGVAALGGIGLVVLVFVFGVPALVILAKLVDAFKGLVAFFKTPLGQVIGIAALIVLAFLAGDLRRTRIAAAERKAEIARSVQAAKDRDDAIKRDVAGDAAARMLTIQRAKSDLESKVSDYEKKLAARGGDPCIATDDDVRDDLRLRHD